MLYSISFLTLERATLKDGSITKSSDVDNIF